MQTRIKRNNHILLFILLGWIAIYSVNIIPMMHNVARDFSALVNVGLLLVLPEYLTVFSAYISFLHKRKNRIILATTFAIVSLLCTVWTSPLGESFLYGETLTIIELLFAILHIIRRHRYSYVPPSCHTSSAKAAGSCPL